MWPHDLPPLTDRFLDHGPLHRPPPICPRTLLFQSPPRTITPGDPEYLPSGSTGRPRGHPTPTPPSILVPYSLLGKEVEYSSLVYGPVVEGPGTSGRLHRRY